MPNTRLIRRSDVAEEKNPCGCQDTANAPAPEADPEIAVFEADKAIAPSRPSDSAYDGYRIVGGEPVTNDFLDCCAVGSQQSGFFCSGTLVAPRLVVTAGHCTDVTQVFFGDDVQSQGTIIHVMEGGDKSIEGADLRVLILAEDAPDFVPRRRVAQDEQILAAPATALLVGFGNVDFAGSIGYGRKRKVEVPIVSLGCASGDSATYGCEQRTEMVAGQRGLNRDSCTGDSGGPLYIQDQNGEYLLLGATSRGIGGTGRACGDGGIYVRIDQFCDQIRQKTGVDL